MAYEFHYTPTGTGVISGKEVLEQTEDAINDLSGQISGDVQIAIDTANNALNTANTASADAQNAINTANTAYTAATNAQNTANTAQNTASNALTAAQNAQNDVNALGNRVTTAENNISQNTSDISGLTTRMGTAEGNIGNLQTAVSNAQATANTAQQTATTARQQSYVFRYSSTALVASSTNSNTLLDNTDNLKVGDKVIDSNGVLFSITAIDTANSTFTIGTALIDLAQDSDVVHKSGNETVGGVKTFTDSQNLTGYTAIRIYSPNDEVGVLPSTSQVREIRFTDKNNDPISYFSFQHRASSAEPFRTCWRQQKVDGTSSYYSVNFNNLGEFYPEINNPIKLGTSTNRWSEVYAQSYYYGSNNVEFSTKFVTTDTAQTISGNKTFSSINGVEPSSLSLPDLSNAIDISSYITDLAGAPNVYTTPANGYIVLRSTTANLLGIVENTTGMGSYSRGTNQVLAVNLPVVKNSSVSIYAICSNLTQAKFIPCQGNV